MTAHSYPQQANARRATRHLDSPPTLEQVEQLGAEVAQAQERLTQAKRVEAVAHHAIQVSCRYVEDSLSQRITNGCDHCVRRHCRAMVRTDRAQQTYDAVHPVWVQVFVDWLVSTVEDEPRGWDRR